MIWTIAGWVLWGLVALIGLGSLLSGSVDAGVRSMMRLQGLVLLLGAVVTVTTDISKFHLLWVLPLAFFIPMAVMRARMGQAMGRLQGLEGGVQEGLEGGALEGLKDFEGRLERDVEAFVEDLIAKRKREGEDQ